jgi:molecular chaperone DnaK
VAIVSAPNNFSEQAKDRLLNAVSHAGVDAVGVVPDGISAILGAFKVLGSTKGSSLSSDGAPVTVTVVDVGGACTQLSLVTIEGKKHNLIKALTIPIGGESFDEIIAKYLASEFSKASGGLNPFDLLQDPQAKQRLHDAAESAKHDLSTTKSTSISIPFISASQKGPLHLNVKLTRAQFEHLLDPGLQEIKKSFKDLLFNGGATAPLKSVLLCGGGARMPVFPAMVREVTGLDATTVPTPEEVSAIGASIAFHTFRKS